MAAARGSEGKKMVGLGIKKKRREGGRSPPRARPELKNCGYVAYQLAKEKGD